MSSRQRETRQFGEVDRMIDVAYADSPASTRAWAKARARICPFGELSDFVPLTPHSALDIGCGNGLFLNLLAYQGKVSDGTGIDIDRKAIDIAKQTKRFGTELIEFKTHRPEQPLPAKFYDIVSMIDVAHHIPREGQATALRDAMRRVKPGGAFLFKDMVPAPRWRAGANQLHDLVLAREWIQHVDPSTVCDLAADEGLSMVASRPINILWYGHQLIVFERPNC